MLEPNNFGKYKKKEIEKAGYEILAENIGVSATDVRKFTGVKLTNEQRLKYCKGFRTGKGMRGYIPVFDLDDIFKAINDGELKPRRLN